MPIDANQDYTAIRHDVLQQKGEVHEGNSLRFDGGSKLYFHAGGADGGSVVRFWNKTARETKFSGAAEQVKASLTRQFPDLWIDGEKHDMGNLVWSSMGMPNRLSIDDFERIDRKVAIFLKHAAAQAEGARKNDLKLAARLFAAANKSPADSRNLTNWNKNAAGVRMMRKAVAADLASRGVADGALADRFVARLGRSIRSGLTVNNALVLADMMRQDGFKTNHVDHLAVTASLDVKHMAMAQDLDALNRTLAGAIPDDVTIAASEPENQSLGGELDAIVEHCERARTAIDQYVAQAGAPGQQSLFGAYEDLRTAYEKAIRLADQQGTRGSDNPGLRDALLRHAGFTYDLAQAMLWEPGAAMTARTPMHVSADVLDRPSDIYGLGWAIDGGRERPAVALPNSLHSKSSKEGAQSPLQTLAGMYNTCIADMQTMFDAFQKQPGDEELTDLYLTVENASVASDGLLFELAKTSGRRNGAADMPTAPPRGRSRVNAGPDITGSLVDRIKMQRDEIHRLRRSVGHVNDKRNHQGVLSNMTVGDQQTQVARRNLDAQRRMAAQTTFLANMVPASLRTDSGGTEGESSGNAEESVPRRPESEFTPGANSITLGGMPAGTEATPGATMVRIDDGAPDLDEDDVDDLFEDPGANN